VLRQPAALFPKGAKPSANQVATYSREDKFKPNFCFLIYAVQGKGMGKIQALLLESSRHVSLMGGKVGIRKSAIFYFFIYG
jgi:hypothetical protein